MVQRIAIFASGSGSNAREIIKYFHGHSRIQVGLILSNRQAAGVFQYAEQFNVPSIHIPRKGFQNKEEVLNVLSIHNIQWIALAGFLLLIPPYLIQTFSNRILNIHPALLPKYGGKGMYGMYVHEEVKRQGEANSGPTIHLVNEHYDEGQILFQASCAIDSKDSAEDIARKVLALEHRFYGPILEQTILENV